MRYSYKQVLRSDFDYYCKEPKPIKSQNAQCLAIAALIAEGYRLIKLDNPGDAYARATFELAVAEPDPQVDRIQEDGTVNSGIKDQSFSEFRQELREVAGTGWDDTDPATELRGDSNSSIRTVRFTDELEAENMRRLQAEGRLRRYSNVKSGIKHTSELSPQELSIAEASQSPTIDVSLMSALLGGVNLPGERVWLPSSDSAPMSGESDAYKRSAEPCPVPAGSIQVPKGGTKRRARPNNHMTPYFKGQIVIYVPQNCCDATEDGCEAGVVSSVGNVVFVRFDISSSRGCRGEDLLKYSDLTFDERDKWTPYLNSKEFHEIQMRVETNR